MRKRDLMFDLIIYNRALKRFISFILSREFIVNSKIYQAKYQKEIKKKIEKFAKKPHRVMIENTNACNANCSFCPHGKMQRKVGFMSLDLYKKIIDQCARNSIDYVTVYGFGEPLMDKDFIERIQYAKQAGLKRVTTNTNASLLNSDKARELLESGIDEVYISFDAASEETYKKIRCNLDFNSTKKNILNFVRLRNDKNSTTKIYLSFVESDDNKHEVKRYIQEWKGLVDGVSVSLIHNWTGDIESKEFIYKKSLLRDPCRLLWMDMVINWDGKVPLCCNDYEAKVELGDINSQTIMEVWGGQRLELIRQNHLKKEFGHIPICVNCQYNFHYKSPWWVSK